MIWKGKSDPSFAISCVDGWSCCVESTTHSLRLKLWVSVLPDMQENVELLDSLKTTWHPTRMQPNSNYSKKLQREINFLETLLIKWNLILSRVWVKMYWKTQFSDSDTTFSLPLQRWKMMFNWAYVYVRFVSCILCS